MAFAINENVYIEHIRNVLEVITNQKDYITELDAATGDGDHWFNLNTGFNALVQRFDELYNLRFADLFKKVGTILMSEVGGSSGILLGSAYLAMSSISKDLETITRESLIDLLDAMKYAIMKRGNAEPGQKTMIDALDFGIRNYRKALDEGVDDQELLNRLISGVRAGAESTRNMVAIKGRASYQENKGVGHLDPGAVTMAIQIETLARTILENV